MKKTAAVIAFLFLLLPSAAFSAFLIELRNGGSIITEYYWQEDGQVLFYYQDGTVGLPADSVKAISKTTKKIPGFAPVVTGKTQKPAAGADEKAPAEAAAGQQDPPPPRTVDEQALKKLQGEFAGLQERYKNYMGMSEKDLLKLAEDITLWRNSVNNAHLGSSFSDSFAEMVTMLDNIEEMYNKRTGAN